MRTSRTVALLAVAAVALSAPSALASTKKKPVKKPAPPVCHQLVDPAGDSGFLYSTAGYQSQFYDPSLDIVSADVASDSKTITVDIRVKKLTPFSTNPPSTTSPFGREWDMTVVDGNTSLGFSAYDGPFGVLAGSGTVVLDYTRNEVRISRPASSVGAPLTRGTALKNFVASTETVVQLPPAANSGDAYQPPTAAEDAAVAPPTVSYKVGTPSCVLIGK